MSINHNCTVCLGVAAPWEGHDADCPKRVTATDPAFLPAASFLPACIGQVVGQIPGTVDPCPGPPVVSVETTVLGLTGCPDQRRDGPVCAMHLQRLHEGAVDRAGRRVVLGRVGPILEAHSATGGVS